MSNPLQPRFFIVPAFSKEHERALTLYLQDDRKLSTNQWRLLYEGINYLDFEKMAQRVKKQLKSKDKLSMDS